MQAKVNRARTGITAVLALLQPVATERPRCGDFQAAAMPARSVVAATLFPANLANPERDRWPTRSQTDG
jgi:hypothetical protein